MQRREGKKEKDKEGKKEKGKRKERRRRQFSWSSPLLSRVIKAAGRFSSYSCTGDLCHHHVHHHHGKPPKKAKNHSQRLKPGEAIWVPAGQIHAYVSGDCVEVPCGITT